VNDYDYLIRRCRLVAAFLKFLSGILNILSQFRSTIFYNSSTQNIKQGFLLIQRQSASGFYYFTK